MMEVYQNLPEGTLAELIDNVIYMSPSPIYKHQEILQKILRLLSTEITDKERGKIIIAPFDVYLDDERNAVQPDIIVILNSNKGVLNVSGHFHGVPDLVVEVLSPGNRDYDLIRKKDLYEKFGVQEYWIVDPETRLTLGYRLMEGRYTTMTEFIGVIESPLLDLRIQF